MSAQILQFPPRRRQRGHMDLSALAIAFGAGAVLLGVGLILLGAWLAWRGWLILFGAI